MIEYRVTKSKRGMAVGQPVAVDAAAAVLAECGNAVDAAVGAARAEMFADLWEGDEGDTTSKGGRNVHGPLAVGVPGTLAGLQFALDRFGTRTFAEAAAPAIALCLDGFPCPKELAASSQNPS